MAERPNVILIVLDTARADAFSPYAIERDTPAVQQLAARGTAYPKAFAPSCWTVPSHASIFMGGPPRSVGVCRVASGNLCAPAIARRKDKYLPEVLRRNGYETRGVSANFWISSDNGFSVGFDEFQDLTGTRYTKMTKAGPRAKVSWYLDAVQARADDGAQAVEALLQNWLKNTPRSPFFWFVNLIECHSPYLPPKPFNDVGPLQRLAAARDAATYSSFEGVLRVISTGNIPAPRALRRMRHLYHQSAMLMDRWLARLFETLDQSRLLDETIILVTSDHGENFGEGGLIGHGGSLDNRLLWVPLVVAGPGVESAPEDATSLDRLPCTIAELIGIDHPWENRTPGVAVAEYDGFIDDASVDFFKRLPTTPERMLRLTERYTCATNGTLKLVCTDEDNWLFDLTIDPLETDPRPLDSYPADKTSVLRRAIDLARDNARDETMVGTGERSAELEERMRLLGYL